MKKFLSFLIVIFVSAGAVFAGVDKLSQEYLQSTNHFTITKPLAEIVVQKAIRKALKKETGAKFDVKFEGYTTSSIKRGIFKNLELTGKDVTIEEVTVPYIHLKSLTDYNYIDYTKSPMVFKSDMTYAFDILLDDEAINTALKDSDYNKVLSKVNKIAKPFFVIKGVKIKIVDDKMYIITEYNLPLAVTKDRTFIAQSDFQVVNGKIKAKNVSIDTSYGNLGLNKVANLINYLNPLEFTLDLIDGNKYKGNIENINIVDNKVKVDGKIYVKGIEQ
jgi:hypothetical protein